jgi:hypothetical protein
MAPASSLIQREVVVTGFGDICVMVSALFFQFLLPSQNYKAVPVFS